MPYLIGALVGALLYLIVWFIISVPIWIGLPLVMAVFFAGGAILHAFAGNEGGGFGGGSWWL